jgi:hypothetical protein
MRIIGPKQLSLAGTDWIYLRRTILLVQLLNLKNKLAILDAIKVKFIPPGERRKSWSGDMSQRMEEKPTDCSDESMCQ